MARPYRRVSPCAGPAPRRGGASRHSRGFIGVGLVALLALGGAVGLGLWALQLREQLLQSTAALVQSETTLKNLQQSFAALQAQHTALQGSELVHRQLLEAKEADLRALQAAQEQLSEHLQATLEATEARSARAQAAGRPHRRGPLRR